MELMHALARPSTALVVTPHPLTLQGQRHLSEQAADLRPGETLAAFLARHDVHPGQCWVVTIGGVLVHDMHWHRVKPKHGHVIECRRVPQKDALRLVAIIALATVLGPAMAGKAGFLGLSAGAGAQFAATAAYMVGSIIINRMLAPKAIKPADRTTSPTYSLQAGGRNQDRPYQPLALVLGEPYAVPDLAAQPYTYTQGGEQYLWQLFHCGINCADAHTLRIGQTAMDSYADVSVLRSGFATGNSTLPALGTSVDSVAGQLLSAPTQPGAWVVRTSSVNTVRLALDIEASLFNVDASSGAYKNRTLYLNVEYRQVGASTWLPFTPAVAGSPAITESGPIQAGDTLPVWVRIVTPEVPAVDAGTLKIDNASQKPVRRTVELDVPNGQYEVRVRKVSQDYTGTSAANAVTWVQLKSYQPDTASYAGQARLAVQIRASGQLNGALDELNARLRANPMPYWNGGAWVTATDRASGLCNPGAIFLLLCRGIFDGAGRKLAGLGYSDDRIDVEGLKAFMVHCAANGFEFDLFLQDATSIEELLEAVAYAGMGFKTRRGGKLGVGFFSATDPVRGVINMGSISARSFSVSYDTRPTADELEFTWFDRTADAWRSVRMLAPGVTTPRTTARQQLVGVSSEAHAAKLMRFAMAQNVYQRKTVTCAMDLEYMTHQRGSVVALSHDMTQWGYSGRLLAAQDLGGTVRLTLDDTAPGGIPAGYTGRYIGLRLAGEQQMRVFPVKPFTGSARMVDLDAAWPVGVPLPGSSADNPAADCLWVYDFKATPGQLLRVVGIRPSGDGAELSLVPEVPEFWDMVETGAYTPPAVTSLLRPVPSVTAVRVDEELARQGTSYYTDLSLTFDADGNFRRAELWGAVGEGEASPPQRKLAEGTSQTLTWRGGLDERWHLELRVWGDTRMGEPFRLYYDVQGLREPPPPFDVFTVLAQPDGTRQYNYSYTSTEPPLDWLGAEIRYTPGTVAFPEWDSMLPLQDTSTHYTASPVETNAPLAGAWTFACRSRDTTGNLSTAKVVSITLPDRRSGSVYAEVPNDPAWPGTRSSFALIDSYLVATSTATWVSAGTWASAGAWSAGAAASPSYITPALDLESEIAGQVDVQLDADGTATVELSTSANGTTWGAWQPVANTFTARYIRLRVTLTAAAVPTLRSLAYTVSAEVKREYVNDVVPAALTGGRRIGTGDVRVPLEKTYTVIRKAVAVIQDSTAGSWTATRIDRAATGPRFQFRLNGTLADPALVDFDIEGI